MQPILAPIKPGESGTQVANLQDALFALLEAKIFRPVTAPNRPTQEELQALTENLKQERERSLFGKATQQLIMYFQVQQRLGDTLGGVVEEKTADLLNRLLTKLGVIDETPSNEFTVKGMVTQPNGKPALGLVVRAFDRDLRKIEPVGKGALTSADGRYEISYSSNEFSRAEKDNADLVLRVYSPDAAADIDKPLVESPTLFNAPLAAEIDLAIPDTALKQSELERHVATITPLLAGQAADGSDLQIVALTEGDFDFIVRDTGMDREQLRLLVLAAKMANDETLIRLPTATQLIAFYGWFRGALPTEWNQLRLRPVNTLRQTLLDAIDRNIVPATLHEQLEEILAHIPNAAHAEWRDLIGATLPAEITQKVVGRIDSVDVVDDALLARLVETKTIESREAEILGLTVSLHRLAGPSPAVMSTILNSEFPSVRSGKLKHARDLAAIDPADWARALDAAGAPVPDGMSRGVQARALAMQAAAAYPEDSFRRQAARISPTHDGANERIRQVEAVLARNPDVNFVDLDYLPDSIGLARVDFGDLPAIARAQVVADLKAHQRVHAVTGNAIPAQELLQAGFTSASAIAMLSSAELSEKAGLTAQEAAAYHNRAIKRANVAAVNWFGIYDVTRDRRTTPVRVIPSHEQFFRSLEGYAALVNDQPWCECAHCQSVLSPAAYFVDLMHFIEQHILTESFKGQETHPLHLEERRPDLWELELTCANTTDYVPYLDLVNEILERFLKDAVPFVDTSMIYKHLAGQDGSFKQPFTLPLDRLGILLGHFGLTRYDIAHAMEVRPDIQARARLGLSLKDYELITTERFTDAAYLLALFRVKSDVTLPDIVLAAGEMATLVGALDLPHDTVKSILGSRFVGNDGSTTAAIKILLGKRDPNDVQNNSEVVHNLTLRRLDRINRFVRLWRALAWTIDELDYVLERLAAPNTVASIVAGTAAVKGTLERILDLLDVNATWSLPVDELLALTDGFPTRGLREPTSLFDRLFNQPAFVSRDGIWTTQIAGRFTHPAWTKRLVAGQPPVAVGQSIPADNTLTRLLAGLQFTDGDFVELVAGLGVLPIIDRRAANQLADESIALSHASISVLFRHARLRRLLGCTVAELFQLVGLARTPTGMVETLDDVRAVARLAAWQKTSGFTFDQIKYLVDPASVSELEPSGIATTLIATIGAERSLEFADTLFTQLGLTEAQSKQLIAANLTRQAIDALPFESTSSAYRVRAIGLAGLVIPPAITTQMTADEITALLADRSPLHVGDVALGTALGRSVGEVAVLRMIADPLDVTASAAIARAIQGGTTQADLDRLKTLIARVCRFHTLLPNPVFDLAGLAFVAAAPAVFFGAPVAPPLIVAPPIDLDTVRNVSAYISLAAASDSGFSTASGPADVAAIKRVVVDVGSASDADLARALRTDEARIAALRPHLMLPARTFDALAVITRCLALAEQLGVSGETFRLMTDESTAAATYDGLARAAEDVFGAFRAKYPDATTFSNKLEPFEDKLRTRKRDGLVDYILTRWPTPFADPSKLYEYFLVDVLVQGCARTSRVVAATSSLQLYVHRVLMNLERSLDWNPIDPNNPGVRARFFDSAKRREWQWRQHYRVWEANRRVFLYPENYLEPELRDDKTPLFEELEDSLLMQEIDKASVHDAYSRYITGFDEIARLKIAGSYYDLTSRTLHLFGVTQDDAPIYYYRQVDESASSEEQRIAPQFSAWQKLSLQIPVRTVSPILFEGRLYVFWVETTTRPVNTFNTGTSDFSGYRHTVRVKFSMLRPDGAWTSPQVARFAEDGGTGESRIVEDPRDDTQLNKLKDQLANKKNLVGERTSELTAATEVAKTAAADAQQATLAQVALGNAFKAPPNPGEVLAMGAALIFAGIPPEVTFASLRAPVLVAWKLAAENEAKALENLQLANDGLRTAQDRLRLLTDEIAQLQAAIDAAITMVRWDQSRRNHRDALDNYKPEGWQWDRVYPDVYTPPGSSEPCIRLTLIPKGNRLPVPDSIPDPDDFDASSGILRDLSPWETPFLRITYPLNWSSGALQLSTQPFPSYAYGGQEFFSAALSLAKPSQPGSGHVALGPVTSDVQIVNGLFWSTIMEAQGDAVWMRGSDAGIRLGTSLSRSLSRQFWHNGADSLLDATYQQGLVEVRSNISPIAGQSDPARQNPFHPDNACLTYFRETFFHIPFLVANHLNTQSKFADTQRWYHYIFDPTAEQGDPWRYREFREPSQVTMSLRELLSDDKALTAYRKNPFSPHAIARTRMSAYQKSIVMKYVDNLLDWGDTLFNQFTMESINEATMLYIMAQDILGPQPPVLGSCGEGKVSPKNYRTIRAGLGNVSDFLVELEAPSSVRAVPGGRGGVKLVIPPKLSMAGPAPALLRTLRLTPAVDTPDASGAPDVLGVGAPATFGAGLSAGTPLAIRENKTSGNYWTSNGGSALSTLREGPTNDRDIVGVDTKEPTFGGNFGRTIDLIGDTGNGFTDFGIGVAGGESIVPFGELSDKYGLDRLDVKYGLRDVFELGGFHPDDQFPPFEYNPVDMIPPKEAVFCIPPNNDLMAYWARVEDRLFNIRNCRDISGVRRQPDLFAPEIDPRLLVRMTAAGLSIDDVLNATSGNLPPYRFAYLIEKAKQHAGTVQSLGAQLLNAFEKRDSEELNHLRAVHEQNLLTMRTKTTQLEISAAEDAIESLQRQKVAVEYRQQHFTGLREVGQIAGERKQQQLQGEASNFRTAAGMAQVAASILTIVPDMGAPTAMKFGGSQLGAAGRAVAEGLNAVAAFNEIAGARAGVEASNRRRDQEWQHQVETARLELAQIEKNISAAKIRRDIAVQSLAIHEKNVTQSEEMFAFFRDKFSSVDRYRLLSKELRRLYRLAFNSALTLTRMVEQAYRAERPADDTLLVGDYWDAESAGLLAGDRLLSDLQRLERQFIERNYRELEVEQSFSLALFAPDDLAGLRITGECQFEVPEWFFDLTYPGQYRRRLKSARVTIPCVVGPHVNIGATLRLERSEIRLAPPGVQQPLGPLTPVPLRHTISLATSKAQNDAGVFDFSFRDERYMPFEGAGAIGTWTLSLPKTLRVFDYNTISDVILHLDYTAEYDEGLKQRWDGTAAQLVALLAASNPGDPPLARVFSLRQEFPDAFHRLLTSPVNTEITFGIEKKHFPFFLNGRDLNATSATLRIITPLSTLTTVGAPRTTFGIRQKMETVPPSGFLELSAPTGSGSGERIKEFEFGTVLSKLPGESGGIAPSLLGEYLIVLKEAGMLAPGQAGLIKGPIDPEKLNDILIQVRYLLA